MVPVMMPDSTRHQSSQTGRKTSSLISAISYPYILNWADPLVEFCLITKGNGNMIEAVGL